MSLSPSIIINKLVLFGKRKNYLVAFNPGVNIIYGDADTGKSSILELVNYLLGANKLNLYEELETSVKYALLELFLNDQVFCIKRDIFEPNTLVEVYRCELDEIEKYNPTKYLPNFSNKSDEYLYFSDFILDSLGLPKLKIKQSPTKDDSKLTRFSFRDLFKYCYLNQDDLGSKNLLDLGNYAVEAKNRETFKYIFNLLDDQISELQAEISDKSSLRNNLTTKAKAVSEFLRDSDFNTQSDIDTFLAQIDANIILVRDHLNEINQRMTADSVVFKGLKETYDETNCIIEIMKQDIDKSSRDIQQYIKLRNDYIQDIEKLKSSIEIKARIGTPTVDISICPVCNQQMTIADVKEHFEINDKEKLNYEINSIKMRIRDLNNIIADHRSMQDYKEMELQKQLVERESIKKHMDSHTSELITPYISERDSFVSELASLEQERKDYLYRLKIRNQHNQINDSITFLDNIIISLNDKLEKLRSEAPAKEQILSGLADRLNNYLKIINIKNRHGIAINERTFLPVIRGVDYKDISSGGLRTITSIGYFSSIISLAKNSEINIPPFLMIDTVGKYLGKTNEKYLPDTSTVTDRDEEMSDPSKYRNIYEYLISLSMEFEAADRQCQFILVDNDVPPEVANDYKGFVIAHFSSDGKNNLPIGLIDDADILQ